MMTCKDGLVSLFILLIAGLVSCVNEDDGPIEPKIFDGDVILLTQQEVDDFGQEGWTSVTGNFSIGEPSSVTAINSLTALSNLTEVGRAFSIYLNEALTSLDGLGNLSSVEGGLFISNNQQLTDMSALAGLHRAGFIRVTDNSGLTTIDFPEIEELGSLILINNAGVTDLNFDKLENITDLLSISGMRQLRNLSAFSRLTVINELSIVANPLITTLEGLNFEQIEFRLIIGEFIESLEGLSSLQSLGGFSLVSNTVLKNLKGLEGIEAINGDLVIANTTALESFEGLEQVQFIEGRYTLISRNTALTTMKGLDGLREMIGTLNLEENTALADYCALTTFATTSYDQLNIEESNRFVPTAEDFEQGNCSL